MRLVGSLARRNGSASWSEDALVAWARHKTIQEVACRVVDDSGGKNAWRDSLPILMRRKTLVGWEFAANELDR